MGKILRRCRQRFMVKGLSRRAGFVEEYPLIKVQASFYRMINHLLPPARKFSISITSRSISRDASRLKKRSPQNFLHSQHTSFLRSHEVFRAALESRPIFFGVIAAPLFHRRKERANVSNTPCGRVGR